MFRFKLKENAGAHRDEAGKDWQAKDGHVFETDKPLDKMFVNKFDRLESVAAPAAKASKPAPVEQDEEEEEIDPFLKKATRVSDDRAAKGGLSIFKKGKVFGVVNDAESGKLLNDEPLSAATLKDFLDQILGKED